MTRARRPTAAALDALRPLQRRTGPHETGPMHDDAHPFLVRVDAAAAPEAVALVLHGGQEHGTSRTSAVDPPVVRMLPFARAISRAGRHRIATYLLRDAVRGYNGEQRSPVVDARWALERIREQHPGLPIALVGHSMGGRVALDLAGDDGVAAVVGLAPWVAERYPTERFAGRRTLLIHGRWDKVTDPRATRRLAERIRAAGGDAAYLSVDDLHAMLLRARTWHRATAQFVARALLR